MSVPKSNSEIETDLESLEAEAMQQLEAEGATDGDAPQGDDKPEGQDQTQVDGERETPESGTTPDDQTTDTSTEGGEPNKPDDRTDTGASDEGGKQKPESGDDGGQPSDKAMSRQHQLAIQLKAEREEKQRLQRLLQAQQKAKSQSKSGKGSLPWDQDGDGEITAEEIEQNIDARADAIVEHKLFVREAMSNFKNDLDELEKEPELNTESDQFDQDLVDFISENYKARLEKNPALRLKDYANKILDLRRSAAQKAAQAAANETQKNLKKRAATQPITGGGSSQPETSLTDAFGGAKTIEELDALAEKSLPVAKS